MTPSLTTWVKSQHHKVEEDWPKMPSDRHMHALAHVYIDTGEREEERDRGRGGGKKGGRGEIFLK